MDFTPPDDDKPKDDAAPAGPLSFAPPPGNPSLGGQKPPPWEKTSEETVVKPKETAKTSSPTGAVKLPKSEVRFEFSSAHSSSIGIAVIFSLAAFAGGWFAHGKLAPPKIVKADAPCSINQMVSNPKVKEGLPNCGNKDMPKGSACVLYVQNTFSGIQATRVRTLATIAEKLLQSKVTPQMIINNNSEPAGESYNNVLFTERQVQPGALVQFYIPPTR